MPGTITAEDREFVETWEHISAQRWGITRIGPAGDYRNEVIVGRRNFMLTSAERIITQDQIKSEDNDPFLNGSFRPVIVPDSVTIQSNPNALSDDEILAILNMESEVAWRENLEVIDSVATLRRMIDIADQSNITVKRYRELEKHLEATRGVVRLEYNDPALRNFLDGRPNLSEADASAARKPESRRGKGTGRSRDYHEEDPTA